MSNVIQRLYEQGQSIWCDNISRRMIETGELQSLIDLGVVGVRRSPGAYICLVCDGPHGGHRFNQDGSPVTEAEYELSGSRLYVRVEATDEAGRTAWSNPIFLFD